jgi:raffinose/stachyose/melibiose transport system substrate-binding protein
VQPVPPTTDSPWLRARSRREVLKLGATIAIGGALSPLISACLGPRASGGASAGVGASDSLIVLVGSGADPNSRPELQAAYDDFAAQNPGVEWDIRFLPGGGPEWDRRARAAVASGEDIGFIAINGQQVRGWVRDGLLADLSGDPAVQAVLERVPEQYHLTGPGESTVRAFPLAVTGGVHTTGLYYNRALLDAAGLEPPQTFDDLRAAVEPLSQLDAAPLVHCSGDVVFNQMLITWVLPMIAERTGDPVEFAESTIRGDTRYDNPEWIEALQEIANLSTSGVMLEGSAATDYATMQQLLLQGRAAMTYNGSWLLPELQSGTPAGAFELHVAAPPMLDGAERPRPILAWTGIGLPAEAGASRDRVHAFLEYASQPEVDRAIVEGMQSYSPISESNDAIADEVAQEFLPMFDDAITPLDWLWEPEITAELDSGVQALVRGDADPAAVAAAVQAVADDLRASGRSYYP